MNVEATKNHVVDENRARGLRRGAVGWSVDRSVGRSVGRSEPVQSVGSGAHEFSRLQEGPLSISDSEDVEDVPRETALRDSFQYTLAKATSLTFRVVCGDLCLNLTVEPWGSLGSLSSQSRRHRRPALLSRYRWEIGEWREAMRRCKARSDDRLSSVRSSWYRESSRDRCVRRVLGVSGRSGRFIIIILVVVVVVVVRRVVAKKKKKKKMGHLAAMELRGAKASRERVRIRYRARSVIDQRSLASRFSRRARNRARGRREIRIHYVMRRRKMLLTHEFEINTSCVSILSLSLVRLSFFLRWPCAIRREDDNDDRRDTSVIAFFHKYFDAFNKPIPLRSSSTLLPKWHRAC